MWCDKCEHDPCECRKTEERKGRPCIVVYCSVSGCQARIRYAVGESMGHSFCKWHQGGNAYLMPHTWPAGMPDPQNPWPWKMDDDRAQQLASHYWQARFRQHKPHYDR